jgi:CRP/FNR family transcriptional regulator, cyclic AMP receptor protein
MSHDIDQKTLTEMIDITRSCVSHFMYKFRKLGLISYNGQIEVHSSMLNAVLNEKPHLRERNEFPLTLGNLSLMTASIGWDQLW